MRTANAKPSDKTTTSWEAAIGLLRLRFGLAGPFADAFEPVPALAQTPGLLIVRLGSLMGQDPNLVGVTQDPHPGRLSRECGSPAGKPAARREGGVALTAVRR